MEATIRELAEILDPPMTQRQIAALIWIHVIPAMGVRTTGKRGRPASTYTFNAVRNAHWQEAHRTSKQFADGDWMASALLACEVITADTAAGEIRWFNGERAERLGKDRYGYIDVGQERVAAHRIIWIAADGEIPPRIQVNHANGIRWDNRRANLELVTLRSNLRHRDGLEYVTYHDAVSQLAQLTSEPDGPDDEPQQKLERAGGAFRHLPNLSC